MGITTILFADNMTTLLHTSRLALRAFTPKDAPLLAALDADTDVVRYANPMSSSLQGYEEIIASWERKYYTNKDSSTLYGFWAVEERETGVFLGWYLLRPALDFRFAKEAGFEAGEIEIGYRFHNAAWGKGYATEGSQELVRRALAEENTIAVVAVALVENRASTRVMEKCGLVPDGEVSLPGYEMRGVRYKLLKNNLKTV